MVMQSAGPGEGCVPVRDVCTTDAPIRDVWSVGSSASRAVLIQDCDEPTPVGHT